MTLTERQVERYSRQIILPEMGGIAQERLLSSRVVLVGDLRDLDLPLYYLVGSGVGRVILSSIDGSSDQITDIIDHARRLNSAVTVEASPSFQERADLYLILIGSEGARLQALNYLSRLTSKTIVARLDHLSKIVIVCSPNTQRLFFEDALRQPINAHASNRGFAAMVATSQAVLLLKSEADQIQSRVIELKA